MNLFLKKISLFSGNELYQIVNKMNKKIYKILTKMKIN